AGALHVNPPPDLVRGGLIVKEGPELERDLRAAKRGAEGRAARQETRKAAEKGEVVPKRLSKSEARSLTDSAKADAVGLWRKLAELHERAGYEALGYDSWDSFIEAEFGFSRVHGYRLLKAAEVLNVLGGNPGVTA